jgi:hypothetical protein
VIVCPENSAPGEDDWLIFDRGTNLVKVGDRVWTEGLPGVGLDI